METPRRPEKHHAYQMTQLHCSSESFASPPLPTTRRRGSQIEQISANISGMELVSAMVREMQSRARHGWQAVQGSFTTYSNKWQRVWTLRGPQDECGALSCDGAARRKTCLSQSARIRLFGRTCMLFYLRLGRIRPYSTPPDPWAPGASPGPVLRATYAALVAHEEAPARVCLKWVKAHLQVQLPVRQSSDLSS